MTTCGSRGITTLKTSGTVLFVLNTGMLNATLICVLYSSNISNEGVYVEVCEIFYCSIGNRDISLALVSTTTFLV